MNQTTIGSGIGNHVQPVGCKPQGLVILCTSPLVHLISCSNHASCSHSLTASGVLLASCPQMCSTRHLVRP